MQKHKHRRAYVIRLIYNLVSFILAFTEIVKVSGSKPPSKR